MPRHCLKSFWSLKLDFDNEFPAKTPKLYSTTTTVETAIDPTQFLVETPPFWPFSKYTDPSSTDPAYNDDFKSFVVKDHRSVSIIRI